MRILRVILKIMDSMYLIPKQVPMIRLNEKQIYLTYSENIMNV